MPYILGIAVIGILILQAAGAVPTASVGGPLTVALAFFTAAVAVAIHEAVVERRGPVGWAVNILVAFAGAFVAAQAGGFLVVMLAGLLTEPGGSLARAGGGAMAVALAGGMIATVLGSWAAIRLVNRWR